MRKLQNTLYITRQGAYLHKERETLIVTSDQKKLLQVPIHSLGHIFCFGNVLVSPFVLGFCGENNVNLAFFTEYGRFLGRLHGWQSGNVLLRRIQYKLSETHPVPVARNIIAAKIQASKRVLQRRLRNHGEQSDVSEAVAVLTNCLRKIRQANSLEKIRGIEGESAAQYFSVFQHLVAKQFQKTFVFSGRNRRPPRDPVNAMLSFLYVIVGKDISGALQGVGLDPQIGFLHADRPGRDSLALDILEEFRAWWIDRMVLSLINRGQIRTNNFVQEASGGVRMTDEMRKLLLSALQARKQEKIIHPFLKEEVEIGLLPHIQALLLSRHLRGDLAEYPPFLMR